MKNIFLCVSLLFNSLFTYGQTYSYTAFNGSKHDMKVVEKRNIVILIPTNMVINNNVALDTVAEIIDRMYDYYKITLGYEPNGGISQYRNKCAVAFVNETCGAACGRLGSKGIEIGLVYLNGIINETVNQSSYNSIGIVSYEFGRNFFSNTVASKLSFSGNNYSMANGFATYMGVKAQFYSGALPESRKLLNEFFYWYNELYSQFLSYLVRPEIDANDLFVGKKKYSDRYRIPRGNTGIFQDAAFFVFLDSVFLEKGIFPKFWTILQNQPNGITNQQVFDNIIIASSFATNLNLSDFFTNVLRFTISEGAKSKLKTLPEVSSNKLIHDIRNFNIVDIKDTISILTSTIAPTEPNTYCKIIVKLRDIIIFQDSTVKSSYKIPLSKCFNTCENSENRIVYVQYYRNKMLTDTKSLILNYWDNISSTEDFYQFVYDSYLSSGEKVGKATVDTTNKEIIFDTDGIIAEGNCLVYNFRPIKNHNYLIAAKIKTSPGIYIHFGVRSGLGSNFLPDTYLQDSTKFYRVEFPFKLDQEEYYTLGVQAEFFICIVNLNQNGGKKNAVIKDIEFVDVTASSILWGNKPGAPIITEKNGILKSNYPTGNQWYYNNIAIAGANNDTLVPTNSGNYSVTVFRDSCLSEQSTPYNFIKVSSNELELYEVKVYPNPVKDILTIKSEHIIKTAEIYNVQGQLMEAIINPSENIRLSHLINGTYVIKLHSKDGVYTSRFIKM